MMDETSGISTHSRLHLLGFHESLDSGARVKPGAVNFPFFRVERRFGQWIPGMDSHGIIFYGDEIHTPALFVRLMCDDMIRRRMDIYMTAHIFDMDGAAFEGFAAEQQDAQFKVRRHLIHVHPYHDSILQLMGDCVLRADEIMKECHRRHMTKPWNKRFDVILMDIGDDDMADIMLHRDVFRRFMTCMASARMFPLVFMRTPQTLTPDDGAWLSWAAFLGGTASMAHTIVPQARDVSFLTDQKIIGSVWSSASGVLSPISPRTVTMSDEEQDFRRNRDDFVDSYDAFLASLDTPATSARRGVPQTHNTTDRGDDTLPPPIPDHEGRHPRTLPSPHTHIYPIPDVVRHYPKRRTVHRNQSSTASR